MTSNETVKENLEDLTADIRAKVDQGAERFARNVSEIAELAKESSAAITKSANATGRAVEKINGEVLALGSKSVRDYVELGRQAAEVKNVADLIDLQSTFVTQAFEEAASRLNTVSEIARGAVDGAVSAASARAEAYATFLRKQAA